MALNTNHVAGDPNHPSEHNAIAAQVNTLAVNVKDAAFGAVGDGVTDDTAAVLAALNAAPNGGSVLFPTGKYLLSSTLTVTNKSLRLVGAGAYESILSWTACGANGAIYFNDTGVGPFGTGNQPHKIEIRDMSVLAAAYNLSYGINCSMADSNSINRPVLIDNVVLGQNIEASPLGFFGVGIRCNNTRNSLINRVHGIGEINTNASGQKSTVGIQLDGECTDFKITNSLFIEWLTHVKMNGGTTEGLYCHNDDFVYGDYGVYYDCGTGGEPQLTVTACSFNTSITGVTMINALESVIANNAFFYGSTSSAAGYTGISVSGANSRDHRIASNGFDTDGTAYAGTKTLISITAGTRTAIVGNTAAAGDTAINIAAGVTGTSAVGNVIGSAVTTKVADAGTGTVVVGEMGRNTAAAWATGNAIFDVDGGTAAFLRFFDRAGGTNLTRGEFVFDGGAVRYEHVNDNGTVKQQVFNVDALGRFAFNVGTSRNVNAQTTSGAVTLDASKGDVQAVTLNGNGTSASITNPVTGQVLTVEWIQDGTGTRTYVWPANCKFAGGAAPTASATANWRDAVTFRYDGANWLELGRSVGVR